MRQNKQNKDSEASSFGKIPPQARELEEAVLGAMMLEPSAAITAASLLKKDAFYVKAHQHVYEAICLLLGRFEPVDMLTVCEELKKQGTIEEAGGFFYLTELTSKVASAANIERHCFIVKEKYLNREMIRIGSETIQDAYDDTKDAFELMERLGNGVFNLHAAIIPGQSHKVGEVAKKNVENTRERRLTGKIAGVPSGLKALDDITGGFVAGEKITVGARPGMGKTALMLRIARNLAIDNIPVGIFSMEMTSDELTARLQSAESEVNGFDIRDGRMSHEEWQRYEVASNAMQDWPIYIDDTPALGLFELRAKARRWVQQFGVKLIIIDYLQLMEGDAQNRGNREQEINKLSRGTKALAKQLNIPVMELSQLSRAVETRGGEKVPQLSDLRDSGAIEQDADMVIFLYRPEYYGFEADENGNTLKGKAEIIVAKHRNGKPDKAVVKFIPHLTKFDNLETVKPTDDFDDFNPPIKRRWDEREDELPI